MKPKDPSKDRDGGKTRDRLDETNTNIIRQKIRRKDPNPGTPKPPSQ